MDLIIITCVTRTDLTVKLFHNKENKINPLFLVNVVIGEVSSKWPLNERLIKAKRGGSLQPSGPYFPELIPVSVALGG